MIQVNEKVKECLAQITGPRNTGHTDLQSEVTRIVITSTMRIHETVFEYWQIHRNMRLIESMMGLRPRQGNLRLVFRLFSLMRGLPSIRLK